LYLIVIESEYKNRPQDVHDGRRIAETVKKAIKTGEPQEVLCKTVGYSKAGEEVARFTFTWKMKMRKA